ncbi:unnamed protein product [Effrenium voratum]|uniref:Glycosyltransferase 2-like domain-containing protein n=1 Tax=Effrenium voratum TaxID=2562239 RepID=A0AA36J881_9DINO|nr:unnamed protein product [Effrenium voratum]
MICGWKARFASLAAALFLGNLLVQSVLSGERKSLGHSSAADPADAEPESPVRRLPRRVARGFLPLPVAVYVQAANAKLWDEMFQCLRAVLRGQAELGGTIDLIVSATDSKTVARYQRNISKLPGVRRWRVLFVENRGGDIGQFLQQIVAEPPGSYSAVLKIHTKSKDSWRRNMLKNLCGSGAVVKSALWGFKEHPGMKLLGPRDFVHVGRHATFTPGFCQAMECRENEVGKARLFMRKDEESMSSTWQLLRPDSEEPLDQLWAIVPGSCWWARGDIFQELLEAAPRLLASMALGASRRGGSGQAQHALERWIPTLALLNSTFLGELDAA